MLKFNMSPNDSILATTTIVRCLFDTAVLVHIVDSWNSCRTSDGIQRKTSAQSDAQFAQYCCGSLSDYRKGHVRYLVRRIPSYNESVVIYTAPCR